jgi:hypothetical protein
MEIHVDVGAKMVVKDRQARWCATLAPPDNWAAFYHWTEMNQGMREPYPQSGHAFEWFDSVDELQWAVEAWEAAAPPDAPSLEVELQPEPPPPEETPPNPMPPPESPPPDLSGAP